MDNVYNTQRYSDAFVLSFDPSVKERFASDRRHLLQEPKRVEPRIRNGVIPKISVEIGDEEFCESTGPLRISVEIYPDNECVAYLMAERSISGYGSTVEEAVQSMADMLWEDFVFYITTDDSHLTADAIELKTRLSSLFKEKGGRRQ